MFSERLFAPAADSAVVPYCYPTLTLCNEQGRCGSLTLPVSGSQLALGVTLFGFGVFTGVWLSRS